MTSEASQPTPSRVADSPTYDGAVSQIIERRNGGLLLFYHQSDIGHTAPDGRVVVRRSTNRRQTWTEVRVVHDEPERDIIDPSVVYNPETGRISLFDVAIGFSEPVESPSDLESQPARKNFDTYLVESTDHGKTWESPTKITGRLAGQRVIPFGGGEQTSQGVITCFYSRDWILQALISSGGGQAWDRNVLIAESPPDRELCEPVPCAVSESMLLLYGRDNATGDFFACKSPDGGGTWREPVFFNPIDSDAPTPIWCKKTGPDKLTAVWGDRDDLCIYAVTMSAQRVWQDPTVLEDEPRKKLHEHIGSADTATYWNGNAGDFGYPTFVQQGGDSSELMMSFYDEPSWPNIWTMRFQP